jgi:hypothetical protein
MSSLTIQAIQATKACFVPRKPEIVFIGKTLVLLYPKVDPSMSDLEKALAYQQNHTALASAKLDKWACILALAKRLDLMLTAKSSLADWERKLTKNWFNLGNLNIISWHNAHGAIINGTIMPNNTSILLPVQDSASNQCHAEGLKFVRVQLNLDFVDLNTIRPVPSTILRGEYYIKLPQHTIQLMNEQGVAYNLTTFNGAADLRTLSVGEVKQDIINDTHQDRPFDLLEPAFNLTLCKTNSLVVYRYLKTLIVKLASDTVHKKLFAVLVPSYFMEPQTVLDHIWQSYFDKKGVAVRLSAQVYYATFLNAIRLFYDLKEYPLGITGIFMAHIDPTYAQGFRAHYLSHHGARLLGHCPTLHPY